VKLILLFQAEAEKR